MVITGPRDTLKRARKLRSEMSLPEGLLWRELRKRPGDLKFRRQHPAGIYVLDFYCAKARLAIGVDGRTHDGARAAAADGHRSHFLRSQGVATTRIPASAILEDVEAVVLRVVEICEGRIEQLSSSRPLPLHHPSDGPPPPVGEEV
jgi:very-short-patch-repair endonuclease